MVEYNSNRLQNIVSRLRETLGLPKVKSTSPKEEWPQHQHEEIGYAEDLLRLIEEQRADLRDYRVRVARLAYRCAQSTELSAYMIRRFGDAAGTKAWRAIRFIARAISACRLFVWVARELPQFRTIRVCQRNPPDAVQLDRRFIIPIGQARQRLGLSLTTESTKEFLTKWDEHFNHGCSQRLSTHAEIQLLLLYAEHPNLQPTTNYLGCSKKACLLCEATLLTSPIRLRVRGRHGGCYPLWGIPSSHLKRFEQTLLRLADDLIQRVKEIEYTSLLTQALPQSTVFSNVESKDFRALGERRKAIAEQQRSCDAIRDKLKLLYERSYPTAT